MGTCTACGAETHPRLERQKLARIAAWTILAAAVAGVGALSAHPLARAALVSWATLGRAAAGNIDQAREELRRAETRTALLPACQMR
jgi:hypothetical protein